MNLAIDQQLNNFVTCTVDELSYVATSKDKLLMPWMYCSRNVHAKNNIHRFHELAKKYYNVDDSEGYFLDIGANIGTAGTYFIKKLAPNLKVISFEPEAENFKLS